MPMSLFGSIMNDFDDDPFFGSHMRHMRQMNNMMSSLFNDPFGMFGDPTGGRLAIGGPRHGSSLMPFMPQMPSLNINRLLSGGLDHGMMGGGCNSFSSSTVIMSNGPHGRPQVISSTSSTKVGPNGVKETTKTMQDSRTGTKKMAIGHHIGERGHVIEREQNVLSGDSEEHQEFINLEEEEVDEFDKEFHDRAGAYNSTSNRARLSQQSPLLALTASPSSARRLHCRASGRRPIRQVSTPLALQSPPSMSASARETYGSSHPQRPKHRHPKSHHMASPPDH